MSTLDYINIIMGIASILLAILSAVLTIVFFFKSTKSQEAVSDASKKIENKTDYLEKLFDKIYKETFSLVREHSIAMQKHIFKSEFGTTNDSVKLKQLCFDVMVFAKTPKTKQEIMAQFELDDTIFNQIHEQIVSFENFQMKGDKYCFGPTGNECMSETSN
ncbi:MAG: hypothetical protein J6X70_00110 [Muribaculaceae bacterium]|nr:hypothetical protein [Muribaculaceae bacterium]